MAQVANVGEIVAHEAENDLSAKQYYFVELGTGDNQVDVCDGAGDVVVGILQNMPTAGQAADVKINGRSLLVASTAIAKGAYVGTTSAGKGVTKSSAGDLIWGIAITAAAADGDLFEIQFMPGRIHS